MKSRKSSAKSNRTESEPQDKTEEAAFVEALIASGEAARPGPDGQLPAGATHELIETEDGELKAVRRRFSAY